MKRLAWLTVLAMMVLVACGGGEEENQPDPNAPPPPPEPTAAEISGELLNSLKPLQDAIVQSGGDPPVEVREQALAQVRQTLQKFQGKEHLATARSNVVREIEARVDEAIRNDVWTAVDDLTAAWAVFEPTSPKLARINEKVQIELSRPRPVGNPSFITDEQKGVTTVLINVYYPDTRAFEQSVPVREGEDFANGRLRLKQIIGRNQGVRIVDNEDGKTYELRNSR